MKRYQKSDDWLQRETYVISLGKLGCTKELLQIFQGDEDVRVRSAAARYYLEKTGSSAVSTVCKALQKGDIRLSPELASCLANHQNEEVFKTFKQVLGTNPSQTQASYIEKMATLMALEQYGDKRAIEVIEERLDSQSLSVQGVSGEKTKTMALRTQAEKTLESLKSC